MRHSLGRRAHVKVERVDAISADCHECDDGWWTSKELLRSSLKIESIIGAHVPFSPGMQLSLLPPRQPDVLEGQALLDEQLAAA